MNIDKTTYAQSREGMRADFQKKGYALFPSVISRERILEIREFLVEEFTRQYPVENYDSADIIFDHLVKYPNLWDTITSPPLVEALKTILGDDIVLMPPASLIRNSFWNLHTDVTTMSSQGYFVAQRPCFSGVAIAIYLQDADEQGGGMFVVPKTHLLEEDPLIQQKLLEKGLVQPSLADQELREATNNRLPDYSDYSAYEKGGIDVPSKMGDVLVMDMRLLHRGSQPQTGVEKTKTKLGIFTTATAPGNGDYLDYWMEYLLSDHDHPFHYLKQERDTVPMKKAVEEAGFAAVYH